MTNLFTRGRIQLARRPVIRWALVAILASLAASIAVARLDAAESARRAWGTSTEVLVATVDHRPGDRLTVRPVAHPAPLVPAGAVATLPDDAVARQHLSAGAVVERADLATATGPAATAGPDEAVVAIPATDGAAPHPGLAVDVVADGVVLAADGSIVHVDGSTLYVAVDRRAAPTVAAAALMGTAGVAYLP